MKTPDENIRHYPDAAYDYIFITEVHSNVKGLEEKITFETPLAVITGPNGSGKTALMNAITLAIFGEIFEAGARKSAKSWELISHLLPPNEPTLFSKVSFSNGKSCSYTAGPGQKPIHHPPAFKCAAPMESALAALAGSRETLLDFLYLHYAGQETRHFNFQGGGLFVKQCRDIDPPARPLCQKALARKKRDAWAKEARTYKDIINRVGDTASTELLTELRVEADRAEKARATCAKAYDSYKRVIEHWFERNKERIVELVSREQEVIEFHEVGSKLYVSWNGHIFTSGAETLALASRLCARAPNAAPFNLVILPDRMVDDWTAALILDSLGRAEHFNTFMPRLAHTGPQDQVAFERR